MSPLVYLFFFLCVAAVGIASPATQKPCSDKTKCTVSNVDITPCSDKKSCRIKRGVNATINFDFVPEFSASELKTEVSWRETPFNGLDPDACKFTACPVAQGVSQPLSYNLYIGKKMPLGSFDIKWKLWNAAEPTDLCCFFTKIQIVK